MVAQSGCPGVDIGIVHPGGSGGGGNGSLCLCLCQRHPIITSLYSIHNVPHVKIYLLLWLHNMVLNAISMFARRGVLLNTVFALTKRIA